MKGCNTPGSGLSAKNIANASSAKELLRRLVLWLSVLLLFAIGLSQLRGEWGGGPAGLHQGLLLCLNAFNKCVFIVTINAIYIVYILFI